MEFHIKHRFEQVHIVHLSVELTHNPGLVQETVEGNKHRFEQVNIVHRSVEQTDNPCLVQETVEQIEQIRRHSLIENI